MRFFSCSEQNRNRKDWNWKQEKGTLQKVYDAKWLLFHKKSPSEDSKINQQNFPLDDGISFEMWGTWKMCVNSNEASKIALLK